VWGLGVVGCLGPNPAFDEARENGSGSGSAESTVASTDASTTTTMLETASTDASTDASTAVDSTGPPPDVSCDVGDPDLLLCFDFESFADGELVDGSMYGHHASANDVTLVDSPWGRAIATTDATRIAVPCFEDCEAIDALTLEARVRLEAMPAPGQRIGVLDNDLEYAITYSRNDGLRCSTGGGQLTGPELPLGEWVHVACTYDGADIRAYIDGVEVASVNENDVVGGGDPSPIAVANTAPNWNEPFIGALDRVRVWRRVRSATEICDEFGC
jgi:hypothetical protein